MVGDGGAPPIGSFPSFIFSSITTKRRELLGYVKYPLIIIVCVRACAHVCVRACVCAACVRPCVCGCMYVHVCM